MLRDEGVDLIKQQLAFRTTLDSEIVTQIKLAQTTLERGPTKPWFLESPPTPLVTIIDNPLVTLPAGFICEIEDKPLFYVDAAGIEHELIKDDYDVLRLNFRSNAKGAPEAYALLNESIMLFPTPDAVYNLSWRFHKADTVLDTNVENGWLREVPLLLLGSAGQLIAGGPLRDKAALEIFGQWIATGLKIIAGHDTQRNVAGRMLQVGGAHN